MGEYTVKVFIYDLTKGLARTMSMPLLGKQLDGVWHTGIVVYGQEFFYGGDSISSCPPCGTILGQPDRVVDLGTTQIPQDMFMDYLHELSTSTYRPECYNLLSHNCNTFSNEVANFLTGSNIPSYVTNLPQEVLSTPFGAMMKPFVDAMSVSPGGGHELFPATPQASTAAATAARQPSAAAKPSAAASPAVATASDKAPAPAPAPGPTDSFKSYNNKEVLEKYRQNKAGLLQSLSADDRGLLEEISEYLNMPNCDWSLGRPHVQLFGSILGAAGEAQHKQLVCELLQLACMRKDVVNMLKYDPQSTVFKILLNIASLDASSQCSLVKAACNMCCHCVGLELLTDTTSKLLNDLETCHRKVIMDVCISCILDDDEQLNSVGAALGYNLTHAKISEEVAVEMGVAVAQLCSKQLPDDTAECALCILWRCMQANPEVTSVVAVMGLDLLQYQTKSGCLQQTYQKINQALQNIT